jgi:site-specific DNA-methyltransferase (adenine-specific)
MDVKNKLFCGDNLDIIQKFLSDDSVDLIYLDPPLNKDAWYWEKSTETAYYQIITQGPKNLSDLLKALKNFIGTTDIMDYLIMITTLLIEIYRVLKPTGSIYLHCNPTISHYLKLILDGIFGIQQYRNEIVWCFDNKGQKYKTYEKCHDILFYYTKSEKYVFNWEHLLTLENERKKFKYSRYEDEKGDYHLIGRFIKKDLDVLDYYNYTECVDYWIIPLIKKESQENLDYPGQKPETLLEHIIKVSSNEGDVIMDPFCGSGTTIVVAEDLNRCWIGIDVSNQAIDLTNSRLMSTFGVLGGG